MNLTSSHPLVLGPTSVAPRGAASNQVVLRERIGPERCLAIHGEVPAIRGRFVQPLARVSTVGDGAIALLPSNAKLDAAHAPWMHKTAGWCENWPPPPEPRRTKANHIVCCASVRVSQR
jgi:hypothetical protein